MKARAFLGLCESSWITSKPPHRSWPRCWPFSQALMARPVHDITLQQQRNTPQQSDAGKAEHGKPGTHDRTKPAAHGNATRRKPRKNAHPNYTNSCCSAKLPAMLQTQVSLQPSQRQARGVCAGSHAPPAADTHASPPYSRTWIASKPPHRSWPQLGRPGA